MELLTVACGVLVIAVLLSSGTAAAEEPGLNVYN